MTEIKKGMLIYEEVYPILGGYDWQATDKHSSK